MPASLELAAKALLSSIAVAILLAAGCGRNNQPTSEDRNVVLIILDTVRADHLSCYGYERSTSPTIDSLSACGILWQEARSQAPWTLPSHASIWTGLSARAHGTNHIGGIDGFDLGLDTSLPSLPAILSNAGYETASFTNIALLGPDFGFDEGFDWFDCDGSGDRTAEATVDAFLAYLDGRDCNSGLFCVIHLYDAHAPYDPSPPFDTAFSSRGVDGVSRWNRTDSGELLNPDDCRHLVDMYDSEILYVDDELSRLFCGMRSRGYGENTLFIITADHGEEFLDHGGIGHGHALYEEQIHVPLVMCGPGIDVGVVSDTPAALMDLMPTVISYLNVDFQGSLEGVDLLSGAADSLRPIPAGGISPDKFYMAVMSPEELQTCAVTVGSRKVIACVELGRFIQFDLALDPGELSAAPADSAMEEEALYYWATPRVGNPPPVGEMTEEIDSALRDLGYIR